MMFLPIPFFMINYAPMKKIPTLFQNMKYVLFSLILGCIASCGSGFEYPPDLDLPNNLELGQSEVYLNNSLEEYPPLIFEDTINDQLQAIFRFTPDFSVSNSLSFSFLPVSEGNYILHREAILYKGALTLFTQTVNSESAGWQYEAVMFDEGYFNIIELDTINQTIKGEFKAFFEVTEKNGFRDTKLPEKMKFQGIFHSPYERG